MGFLLRVLFFVGLVMMLVRFIWPRKKPENLASNKAAKQVKAGEKMLVCELCGAHTPQSMTSERAGKIVCSDHP